MEKREPDLFSPDLYKAVTFADEYLRCHIDQRMYFVLGTWAGIKQKENSEREELVERVKPKPMLAELCINLGEGQAVVSPEGTVEFCDTGLNISMRDLQFVVQEAEAYMKYREERIDAQTKAQ